MQTQWSPLLRLSISDSFFEEELLQHEAQISKTRSALGSTPLHFAVIGQNVDTLTFLLTRAPVDSTNFYLETPLHWACRVGNPDIVSILIENGADVNFRDSEGNTSLHWANQEENPHIAKILKNAGADPNIRNIDKLLPNEVKRSPKRFPLPSIWHKLPFSL